MKEDLSGELYQMLLIQQNYSAKYIIHNTEYSFDFKGFKEGRTEAF
jgi:hypothetical protein